MSAKSLHRLAIAITSTLPIHHSAPHRILPSLTTQPLLLHYSTNASAHAKRPPARAPRARDAAFANKRARGRADPHRSSAAEEGEEEKEEEGGGGGGQYQYQYQQQQQEEKQRWPTAGIDAAYKAGKLSLAPAVAVDVLDAFYILNTSTSTQGRVPREALRRLCREYEIPPTILTTLGRILIRAGNPKNFPTVRALLQAAASMDDAGATLLLVTHAIATGKMHHADVVALRPQVGRLAQERDPAAMIVEAELLAADGRGKEGIEMCEAAIRGMEDKAAGTDDVVVEGRETETERKAWSTLAKLRTQEGDVRGAGSALERAALELDDPWAYYALANTYRSPSGPEYLRFMLKAAATGVPDAAHKLGRYYLKLPFLSARAPTQGAEQESNVPDGSSVSAMQDPPGLDYGDTERLVLAAEWFAISAASPDHNAIDESRVYLALLARKKGDAVHGRRLLKKATGSEIYGSHAVPWFLDKWDSQRDFVTADFLATKMDRVIRGQTEGL